MFLHEAFKYIVHESSYVARNPLVSMTTPTMRVGGIIFDNPNLVYPVNDNYFARKSLE